MTPQTPDAGRPPSSNRAVSAARVLAVALLVAAVALFLWNRNRSGGRQASAESASAVAPAAMQPADVNASTPPWSRPDLVGQGVSSAGSLPSQLPAFRVGQRQIDDPSRDGWQSEVWNNKSGDQLKTLSTWFVTPGDESALAALVAPDFGGTPLFAASRDSVFSGTGLHVERGREADLRAAHPRHVGPAGLAQALRDLRRFMDAGDEALRVKLKTVGIEPTATGFTTRVLFSSSRGAAREVHATWLCDWSAPPGDAMPQLRGLRMLRYEDIRTARTHPLFADCTEAVFGDDAAFRAQLRPGIHRWLRSIDVSVEPDFEGMQGVALGDVNGDGLEDVYVCQGGGLPNRLYLRQRDGRVSEGGAAAGVDWIETTRGALLVDLDNDGDVDLALALDDAVMVMENDGHGIFAERQRFAELRLAFSLSAVDYDADGDLDLYACRYFAESEKSVGQLPNPVPYHDANNGGRNVLLRNDGGLAFADVTRDVGLDDNNRRWSYAAAWEDYDNDGDLDLYVANDFGRNNLYRNDAGRFADVAAAAGVEDIASGMSASWGDFNRDGWMDLYVGNMFSSAGQRIVDRQAFQPGASDATRGWYRRLARGNTLFQNNGDGTFDDVSVEAGVTMGRWSWGSHFADINNDGLEDLVVANGYVTGEDSGDL